MRPILPDGDCPHPDTKLVGAVVLDRSGGEDHRVDVTCIQCETHWDVDSIPLHVLEAVIGRMASGRAQRMVGHL
jgi:hypothetical protein